MKKKFNVLILIPESLPFLAWKLIQLIYFLKKKFKSTAFEKWQWLPNMKHEYQHMIANKDIGFFPVSALTNFNLAG